MNNIIIPLTYFFIFFPYITVTGLFNSDVQPYAGLIAFVYLLINFKNIKVTLPVAGLVFISFIALAYNVLGDFEGRQLFKFISIPYACVILLFITNTINRFDIVKTSYYCGYVYCFFCYFQNIFPSLYLGIFSHLVRDVKVAQLGGMRGVSALTTEPSFTAFILIIFLAIVYYTRNDISARKKIVFSFFVITSVLLTKSLTGITLLLGFIAWEVLRKAKLVYLFMACGFVTIGVVMFEDTRAVNFLTLLVSNPLAILSESSLFFRVYYFVYGFMSIIYNPLGASLGGFSMEEIRVFTDQLFVNSVPYHTLIRIDPSINMPSTFGTNMYLYGLFYAIAYIVVFGRVFISTKVPVQIKWFIFVLTAQSFSFSFSLLWVLLALAYQTIYTSSNLTPSAGEQRLRLIQPSAISGCKKS